MYWEGAPHTHSKEHLLPNGEPAIIFNLRDEPIRIYDAQDIRRFNTYGPRKQCGLHREFAGKAHWFEGSRRR